MNWLPRIGWRDLSSEEAMALGLEQAGRWACQLFEVEWFGVGFALWARVSP